MTAAAAVPEAKAIILSTSTTTVGDAVLLILALCFHSVFEGIAIGIAGWNLFFLSELLKIPTLLNSLESFSCLSINLVDPFGDKILKCGKNYKFPPAM
jgi:hypothetical protein